MSTSLPVKQPAQTSTVALAREIRHHAIQMVARAKASHIGGALSMADLLAVLYGEALSVRPGSPDWADRDRFILSKGHSCTALYACLALRGFFPMEELNSYGRNGSRLMSHSSHKVPGIEFSTGSLGHGLPFACGKALAAKRQNRRHRVVVMLSDGELDEGSNWEALLFAPQHRLDNLVTIVDYNKIQSLGSIAEVLELHPLSEKMSSFRWSVREINGHDHREISASLRGIPWEENKPSCLIAHTVKGKGVDFMENTLSWHYKSPDANQVEQALQQLLKDA